MAIVGGSRLLVAFLVLVGLARGAGAAELPAAAVSWDAPAGCPTPAMLLDDVERVLAETGRPRVLIAAAAQVTATPGQPWRVALILEAGGVRTERRFEAESCEAAAAATALIVALAGEEEERTDPPPFLTIPAAPQPLVDFGGPPSHPVDVPTLAAGPTSSPVTESRRLRRSRKFITANGVVDWGTLPNSPSPGIEAAAGWTWMVDRWRLRAIGGASFFPTREVAWAPDAGYVFGDFWLFNASGRGCLGVAFRRLEVGPCLGGELAVMRASSSGGNIGAVAPATRPWFSALGSASASWRISGKVVVSMRADVAVPTTHELFLTGMNDHPIYQVPAVAFRGAIGIEHSFE